MSINFTSTYEQSQRDLKKNEPLIPLFLCGFVLTGLIGCKDAERPLTTEERMRAVQLKQETNPDFYLQRKSVDYMSDLREIRDAKPPEKAGVSPRQSVTTSAIQNNAATENRTPAQIGSRPADVGVASSTTNASGSQTLPINTASTTSGTIVPAREQTPATSLSASQEKASLAFATPQAVSIEASSEGNIVRVISSVRPNFPREATQRGIQRGNVRARATINTAGDVTNVDIISANPVGIFNREVINAFQRWKFNAGANNRTFETDIVFQP